MRGGQLTLSADWLKLIPSLFICLLFPPPSQSSANPHSLSHLVEGVTQYSAGTPNAAESVSAER